VSGCAVNRVVDREHRLTIKRGDFGLDQIVHLWFATQEDMAAALTSPAYKNWVDKVSSGTQRAVRCQVEQREMVAPPSNRAELLKRMSILQRAPTLSAAEFQDIWLNKHGPMAVGHPDLLGYLQDGVIAEELLAGGPKVSCDGLTELWFANRAAMERVLPPERGASSLTSHASKILSTITTFLVQESRVF
jgi:hypothetical protein